MITSWLQAEKRNMGFRHNGMEAFSKSQFKRANEEASVFEYYSAICVILVLALGVLSILANEDERLNTTEKRQHHVANAIIALSIIAEWAGSALEGLAGIANWALPIITCFDHVLAPMAGAALAMKMHMRTRLNRAILVIIIVNAVLQVVSVPLGWMVTVDTQGTSSHGPFFWAYLAVVAAIIVIVFVELFRYGRSFRSQNRMSLFATAALVVVGIVVQELSGGIAKTAYASLTLASALLYIHFAEFSQQRVDAAARKLWDKVGTDALTGLLNRFAYEQDLASYSRMDSLPHDLTVISMDVNGLKEANDKLGHKAGDEVIVAAAQCMRSSLGEGARCYRTGGDEFVAFAHMDEASAFAAMRRMRSAANHWQGELVGNLSLSVGFARAANREGITMDELVKQADRAMYNDKRAYYERTGAQRQAQFQ